MRLNDAIKEELFCQFSLRQLIKPTISVISSNDAYFLSICEFFEAYSLKLKDLDEGRFFCNIEEIGKKYFKSIDKNKPMIAKKTIYMLYYEPFRVMSKLKYLSPSEKRILYLGKSLESPLNLPNNNDLGNIILLNCLIETDFESIVRKKSFGKLF